MAIPKKLRPYRTALPEGSDRAEWKLLRGWSLSKVYRTTTPAGDRLIVKWGGGETAREGDVYRNLLAPLAVGAPRLFGHSSDANGAVMALEDVGALDLGRHNTPELFIGAARALARLRTTATARLSADAVPSAVRQRYIETADDTFRQLDQFKQTMPNDGLDVLSKAQAVLPDLLHQLEDEQPLTLIHNDYHAKNLLIRGAEIIPIDWAQACLGRHLGDLYCLTVEAREFGVEARGLLGAFNQEVRHVGVSGSRPQTAQDVRLGGICWLVRSLCWLASGGTAAIDGAGEWIPDLLGDLGGLLDGLERKNPAI